MALDQQTQVQLPAKQNKTQYKSLSRIMIIDDDKELLEELKDFLSTRYEVETLFDSSHAFEKGSASKPDLIIMDMKMFPKTGFQLAYEFKNDAGTKFIPIIGITGVFIEREHNLMMKLSGIKRIILKPFTFDQLLKEIDTALEGSRGHE